MSKTKILVADDDKNILYAFRKTFANANYSVVTAGDGREALEKMQNEQPALIFMDVAMPKLSGLEVLQKIKENGSEVPVVIITGYGTMQTAIQAMRLGAYDYLTKPLDVDKIRITAHRALELFHMRQEIHELQRKLEQRWSRPSTELIGNHPLMQDVYKKIGIASTTPNTTTVLILGETGTGKELVARAIHESGAHADEPFQAINCTVLPESLLESELFGHEKGAFTGADRRKQGKFGLAGHGTLFLDEIGDMPVSLQKKLLRVIQERAFEHLGGSQLIPLNARIMAATHQDLIEAIKKGQFREDLYYRLNVFEILLPPLRERQDDIPLLASYFLAKFNAQFGKKISSISEEVIEFLSQYKFPGNVRELENIIERAVALERGNLLTLQSLPQNLFHNKNLHQIDVPILFDEFAKAKQVVVESFEKKFLISRLKQTNGNVTQAANLSGIERQSFQRLMKKYNLSSQDFRKK